MKTILSPHYPFDHTFSKQTAYLVQFCVSYTWHTLEEPCTCGVRGQRVRPLDPPPPTPLGTKLRGQGSETPGPWCLPALSRRKAESCSQHNPSSANTCTLPCSAGEKDASGGHVICSAALRSLCLSALSFSPVDSELVSAHDACRSRQ